MGRRPVSNKNIPETAVWDDWPEDAPRLYKTCRHCGKQLTYAQRNSSYCSDSHRASYSKVKRRNRREAARKRALPEHVKVVKELLRNQNIPENMSLEAVREVFQEAVRDNLGQHIADQLLGIQELLTDMAPKALAGLMSDLESTDPMDRQRAYAIWFKYVMPLSKEHAKETNDLGKLTVIHQVPVPDTPLGRKFVDEVDQPKLMPPAIETKECYRCHEMKHIGVLTLHDSGGANGTDRWICRSCVARKFYKGRGTDKSGFRGLEDVLEDVY